MVLQRGMNVPIWGWADPGEQVTVSFAGQTKRTKASAKGRWMVKLGPLTVGVPKTMKITGKNTIALTDVLVGEVWLCSGQSNMALTVNRAKDAEKEIAAANYPQIRLFSVRRAPAP